MIELNRDNRQSKSNEFTLDPDCWDTFRTLGHQMLDDMIEYLQSIRNRPVWQPLSEELKQSIKEPLPRDPQDPKNIYEEFKKKILPYPPGNIHPRFWGWVHGTGSPFGMLAEMLAAGMNANTGGREHMPKYVEEVVLSWAKDMVSFPQDSSGVLVSGCSVGNLVALTTARNVKAELNIRKYGLQATKKRMIVYGSSETHSSIQKAIEIIGIGSNNFKIVPVNETFQIKLDILERMIQEDQEKGNLPFCIVGNVGTVKTGAVDALKSLRNICDKENLWFHVDGAFGAIANLSPEYQHKVTGLTLADSLVFDFHKWMSVPYTVACVLVKSEPAHHGSFSLRPSYLSEAARGLASGGKWPTEYGVQLSRTFYALKVWFMLKENGIVKYGKLITQNINQAKYLEKLITTIEKLELLAPVYLNVVCFRYIAPEYDNDRLNMLNQELLVQLQESGVAVPSNTNINGKFALKLAITNHRSVLTDFDLLVEKVIELGDQLSRNINCSD